MMVRFTTHALDQMKARKVDEVDVIAVLKKPVETITTKANRLASYRKANGKYIVVIHEKEDEENIVITVMRVDKRRLERFGFAEI